MLIQVSLQPPRYLFGCLAPIFFLPSLCVKVCFWASANIFLLPLTFCPIVSTFSSLCKIASVPLSKCSSGFQREDLLSPSNEKDERLTSNVEFFMIHRVSPRSQVLTIFQKKKQTFEIFVTSAFKKHYSACLQQEIYLTFSSALTKTNLLSWLANSVT